MSLFIEKLLNKIARDLRENIGASGNNQYRGVFSGPPLNLLSELLEKVKEEGGMSLPDFDEPINPILLPDGGNCDPKNLTTSGKCSDSYLLKMRNSECDQFLILLPTGHPLNESMGTTIQEMGIPVSETRPTFETRFFDELLAGAINGKGLSKEESYVDLTKSLLRNEHSKLDAETKERPHQWGLLKSLYDTNFTGTSQHDRIIATLGLISCNEDELSFPEHRKVLDDLGKLLEAEGINSGFQQLMEGAETDIQAALDACKNHIKSRCKTGSDFLESPALKYAPYASGEIPSWWKVLTLEIWNDLLGESEEIKPEDLIKVELQEVIVSPGKGHPLVVQTEVKFTVRFLKEHEPIELTINRRVGRKPPEVINIQTLSSEALTIIDSAPPAHPSHLEYIFSGTDGNECEIKPVKFKVIALDTYEPGVVAHSRNSARTKPFKLKKKKGKKKAKIGALQFESFMELNSIGQHQLDLYIANGTQLRNKIYGQDVTREGGDDTVCDVKKPSETRAVATIETDEECSYRLKAETPDGTAIELHILLESGDAAPLSTLSEFDRLVLEHQKHMSKVQSGSAITPSSERCSNLQHWILEEPNSYRPLIIGPDFEKAWTLPNWSEEAIISEMDLLQDPRPSAQEMQPPEGFLESRNAILEKIRSNVDGTSRLMEEVNLGELMKEEGEGAFPQILERYLQIYLEWIIEDESPGLWSDVILACKADSSSSSLNPNPYAILLSPLHPLRLAWQCQAQELLKDALDKHLPCPAASALDPSMFPDCMALPFQDTSGKSKKRGFLSIRCDSDYWQVLWNCDYLDDIANPEERTLFCRWFGITVDGLASGFSAAQVKRSIADIRRIFPAKSKMRLLIESDSAGISSCNDGIESWVAENMGATGNDKNSGDPWFEAGPTHLEVFDNRNVDSQPTESQVSRMCEQSGGNLRWFSKHDTTKPADLAVLAHLGTANPKMESHELRSPMGNHGLSKWRIRRQAGTGGKFISETRIGDHRSAKAGIAAQLACITSSLESKFEEIGDSYVFAPNLPKLSETSDKATYCVVSSSSLDPACFFGQTGDFFLWDYELPSFSRRAGENAGYYLLATPSDSMRRAIEEGVRMLGNGSSEKESPELVDNLLKEISSRGMPTLKQLTAGGTAALGEVGVLVALRIFQGDFIEGSPTPGITPVMNEANNSLSLIVPVDPFTAQIDALRKSLGINARERPDLLILTIKYNEQDTPIALKITPVEVKARAGKMQNESRKEALQQAIKLSEFLEQLLSSAAETDLWGIACKHLLCTWLDYGFRVYGQLDQYRNAPKWSSFHQQMISAVLGDDIPIEIDPLGRLVLIDASQQSEYFDTSGNGFNDTLVIAHSDAEKIIRTPEKSILPKIVEMLGHWGCEVSQHKITPKIDEKVSSGDSTKAEPLKPEGETQKETAGPKQNLKYKQTTQSNQVEEPTANQPKESSESQSNSDTGVCFPVGNSIGGFTSQEYSFHPSNTELNQMNIGVVGDLGTGKTQLLQGLLYNLAKSGKDNRGIEPNVLIFDYKKDYSKPLFLESTGARVIRPIGIPLNIFDTTGSTNQMNPILDRYRFFSDTISKIFSGFGPKQRNRLKEAIKSAYEHATMNGKAAPTIKDVFVKYEEACDGDFDSPHSIMSDIIDHGIFVESHDETIPFKEFFKGVVVIDLGALGQDDNTKNMLVAIFLNLFYEHMLKVEKRPFIGTDPKLRALDSFLLVDEANNIMQYEFDVLQKILLQGREFGAGVILASQYPSHFKTSHQNYAESLRTWFIHKIPDINAKTLKTMGFTNVTEQSAERVKALDCHECLYRTLGGDEGRFMRGHPLFEIIKE
jgi:DNA phosphorothioation-dependent restriction protein DptH